jgi:hypothetical protein
MDKYIHIIIQYYFFFVFILFIVSIPTATCSQNSNCIFNWEKTYNFPEEGIDENAKIKAKEKVLKAISSDYSNLSVSTIRSFVFSQVIRTCANDTRKMTIAYANRDEVKKALSCLPDIKVGITGISDHTLKNNIESNVKSFLKSLYCSFEQNTPLNFEGIKVDDNTKTKIELYYKINPFRSLINEFDKEIYKSDDELLLTNILMTVKPKKVDPFNQEIQMAFDQTGKIVRFVLNARIQNFPSTLSSKQTEKIITFINEFITSYYIGKDSVLKSLGAFIYSNGQSNYINGLKSAFTSPGFVKFVFDEISISVNSDSPEILEARIKHGWEGDKIPKISGYLTIYIEPNQQDVLNNFSWTQTR